MLINILFLFLSVWILFTNTKLTQAEKTGFYSYFEPRFKVDIRHTERSPFLSKIPE